MSKRQNRNKSKVLAELEKVPLISTACQRTGVARATYYRWYKEDSNFARQADESLEKGLSLINDMAESQIINGIKNGDFKWTRYWLDHNHSKYHTPALKTFNEKNCPTNKESESMTIKFIGETVEEVLEREAKVAKQKADWEKKHGR